MLVRLGPGIGAAVFLAALATVLAPRAPILGAPVIAIALGIAVRTALPLPAMLEPGVRYSARTVLQGAIVVSGFGISLAAVLRTGLGTLPVTLVTIAVVLILAPLVGRSLQVGGTLRQLVGIGTAICGASAIAAVAAVIEPAEEETAHAIATIFLYNIIAVLTFPSIGHALGLTQAQFGVWAGTAINDTSSVVAAGFAYGQAAGTQATIVKLTRATLILPVVGAVALLRARAIGGTGKAVPWAKIVPWFIVWFLAAALVASTGAIPAAWHAAIVAVATFAISVALAAIGLQTDLRKLLRSGWRPLALGLALWVACAASSLAMQRASGL